MSTNTDERKAVALKAASRKKGVTSSEIKDELGGHAGGAALLLSAMTRKGLLTKTDETRDGKSVYRKADGATLEKSSKTKKTKTKKTKTKKALKKKAAKKTKSSEPKKNRTKAKKSPDRSADTHQRQETPRKRFSVGIDDLPNIVGADVNELRDMVGLPPANGSGKRVDRARLIFDLNTLKHHLVEATKVIGRIEADVARDEMASVTDE